MKKICKYCDLKLCPYDCPDECDRSTCNKHNPKYTYAERSHCTTGGVHHLNDTWICTNCSKRFTDEEGKKLDLINPKE